MKYIFIINLENYRVFSAASGSDDSIPYTGINQMAVDVSESDFLIYRDEVMNSNGSKFIAYNGREFTLSNTQNIPTSIDKLSMAADENDTITISGLPNPSRVYMEDIGMSIVTDGLFTFSTDTPGEYIIICMSEDYLKMEYIINAS